MASGSAADLSLSRERIVAADDEVAARRVELNRAAVPVTTELTVKVQVSERRPEALAPRLIVPPLSVSSSGAIDDLTNSRRALGAADGNGEVTIWGGCD